MKLYLVKRTDEIDYNEYDAVVVRAEDEVRAVTEALYFSGMAADNVEVTEVAVDGEQAVILASFNAG